MSTKTVRNLVAGATMAAMLGSLVPVWTFAAGGPDVTLSSASAQAPTPTSDNPIVVAATISTSTTDFNAGDVSVVNGSVSNFSGSGTNYSFDVTPSNPNDTDATHRLISVSVNDNAFDSNNASNGGAPLQFQYDSTAASSSTATSTPAATSTPVVTITGGPADGSTLSSGSDADFTFTVSDPSAFVACMLNSGSYGCSSPQDFTGLPDGSYVFSVSAGNSFGTSSPAVVNFAIGTSTATSTGTGGGTATSTATSSPVFTQGPAGSPIITITSGPAEGATQTDGTADFTFTVSDASSTVMCSLGDAVATTTSLYLCGSPQNFSGLNDGNYAFEVDASNAFGTSTIVSDFIEQMATTSGSTPTQTTSPSTDNGNGQIVGSGPTAPSGAGSNAGGPPSGNTVIPTSDQPAIPEGTGSTAPANTSPSTPVTEPTVSNSSGGSALVPTGVPTETTTSPSSVGIPNTGVDAGTSSVTPAATIASVTPVAAAAASSGSGIPGWVWAVILLIILAALLWWAYSAGGTTDNPRA